MTKSSSDEAGRTNGPRTQTRTAKWPTIAMAAAALAVIAAAGAPFLLVPAKGKSSAPVAASSHASRHAPRPIARDTFVSWDADQDGNRTVYRSGGLKITLSATDATKQGDAQAPAPVLTVSDGRSPPFSVIGEQGFETARATFGVGRLDPRAGGDQVVFMTFTGGAHCCTRIQVLTRVKARWRVLELGTFDGEGPETFPAGRNPDGATDIGYYDDRFAYAFAPYAGSYMPPRAFEIYGGEIRETSQSRSHAAVFETYMAETKAACLKHENAGCAAFVASAARLGRRDWAWRIMLDNYDKADDWQLGDKCTVREARGKCPPDKAVAFKSFPEALESFLVEAGYMKASDAAFPLSAPVSPSFDCARVRSANLQLVCATPALISQDHDLAFDYAKAVVEAADPAALRAAQDAWIHERNAAPAEVGALQALYARRLKELESGG